MSHLPHLDDTECTALLRAAHHFNAFISPAYEAYRQRQLAHIRACLAECDRTKTPEEIAAMAVVTDAELTPAHREAIEYFIAEPDEPTDAELDIDF